MNVVFILALAAIVFALFAALGPGGLWFNFIALVNVVFSALVATNGFEPIAERIHYSWPACGYFIDFVVVWGLFSVTFTVLQLVTSIAARSRVRIGTKLDQIGGFVVAAITGWVLICFTAMTLHMAPLQRDAFGDALLPQFDGGLMASVAPDRMWLNAAQRLSRGGRLGSQESERPSFDPQSEFILNYATRRHDNYQHETGLFAEREWGAAILPSKDATTK